jgi:hypothetical protein
VISEDDAQSPHSTLEGRGDGMLDDESDDLILEAGETARLPEVHHGLSTSASISSSANTAWDTVVIWCDGVPSPVLGIALGLTGLGRGYIVACEITPLRGGNGSRSVNRSGSATDAAGCTPHHHEGIHTFFVAANAVFGLCGLACFVAFVLKMCSGPCKVSSNLFRIGAVTT